jgi:peptide/nickel transport system substrate-binding protein
LSHRRFQVEGRALATSWLAALLCASAILCACSASSPPERAAGSGLAADTLRVGVTILPPSWGNPFMGNGTPGTIVWYALFDALTRVGADGELEPALATHWSALDPTTWSFELRDGVRFSNGAACDADAVVATLDWLRSPEGMRTVVGNEMRGVASVEAVDRRTVRIVTAAPDAILPKRLASVMIVEPQAWRTLGADGFARAPVGTGPYVLETWGDRDKRSVLRANPDSWRAPRVATLVFQALPDYAVRLQALLSGEIDLTDTAVDDLPLLEHRGLLSASAPAMQVMSIGLITEDGRSTALDDARVRRALNLAVDRRLIAESLLRGLAAPASQPASRVTPGFNAALPPIPHDPQAARALLAEAGYPSGFAMTVDIAAGITVTDTSVYQAVAQYLGDVGVDVTLRSRPFSTFIRNYLTGNWQSDAIGLSWNAAPYNDVARPMEYYSCRKRNPLFCDQGLAQRLEAANSEFDPARREAMLEALARDYREAAPAIFILETVDVYAMHPRVRGFELANRVPVYEAIRLEPAG